MNNKYMNISKKMLAGIALTFLVFTSALADHDSAEIWLYPSGTNDTGNLQAALDNCSGNNDDDCVIRLAKGVFHTNMLVAIDFHGEIRGAGQYATIIRPVEDETLHITSSGPYFVQDPTVANPWPFLITFAEGDISLSNLSITFPDGELNSDPWFLCDGPFEGVLAAAVVITGREPVDFKLSHVSITGGAGPVFGANLFNGIFYGGFLMREGAPPPDCTADPYADTVNLSGKYSATHNTLSNVLSGLPVAALEGAKVSIEDNTFDSLFGIEVIDILNSELKISGNLMDVGAVGISMLQGTGGAPDGNSKIVIEHNDFYVNRHGTSAFGVGFDAIEYVDFAGEASSEKRISIEENWINLGVDVFDGIFVDGDEGALRIEENDFSGEAIGTGVTIMHTDACRIDENSFVNFLPGFTNIFLDETTSNCKVSASEGSVIDLGTGNKVKKE